MRIEGWVFAQEQPDTAPLWQWWHPGRRDNFLTSTAQGNADARAAGYIPIRIEGWVHTYP